MLERIEEIKGVGLFHDANGKPHKFQKATVLYADNDNLPRCIPTVYRSRVPRNDGTQRPRDRDRRPSGSTTKTCARYCEPGSSHHRIP